MQDDTKQPVTFLTEDKDQSSIFLSVTVHEKAPFVTEDEGEKPEAEVSLSSVTPTNSTFTTIFDCKLLPKQSFLVMNLDATTTDPSTENSSSSVCTLSIKVNEDNERIYFQLIDKFYLIFEGFIFITGRRNFQ
jgi:hypothetical protein